jgi:hypothetical protein
VIDSGVELSSDNWRRGRTIKRAHEEDRPQMIGSASRLALDVRALIKWERVLVAVPAAWRARVMARARASLASTATRRA